MNTQNFSTVFVGILLAAFYHNRHMPKKDNQMGQGAKTDETNHTVLRSLLQITNYRKTST
jgi:hypothetical protein